MTWAVLGLIASTPRSGYDIKRIVDRSIRHFWAASYGQIYPELKRLEEAGWIAGDDASNGGRARRVYRITAGRARGARRLVRRHRHADRDPRRVAAPALLRRQPAARPRARPPGRQARGLPADARVPARPRRRQRRARPAVRRSRLPLGPRLLRMGDRMVRPADRTGCSSRRPERAARADVAACCSAAASRTSRSRASCRSSSSTPSGARPGSARVSSPRPSRPGSSWPSRCGVASTSPWPAPRPSSSSSRPSSRSSPTARRCTSPSRWC